MSKRPRGRWDDFRVGWSSALQTGTLPVAGDLASMISDECQISKVHDATDSVDNGFVMFGTERDTTNNLYGVIKQYDRTGNTRADPAASGAGAYTTVHPDSGLVEAAGDLAFTQGDNAPYDMDEFNGADDGGATYQPVLSTTEASCRTTLSLWAPLGLLKITNGSTGT